MVTVNDTTDLAPLFRALDEADSPLKILQAVQALAQTEDPAVLPTLVRVLAFNNPGAAVAAVEGLIAQGTAAADVLLGNIDDYNYGARAWSLRALAGIGDPRALDLLCKAAREDFALSVRRAATRGVGGIRWEQLEPGDRPGRQLQALETLDHCRHDPEWVVRYAAASALELLGPSLEGRHRDALLDLLASIARDDAERAVAARATLALQRLTALT